MNVVSIRKWTFGFSALLFIASLVTLSIPPALTPGIDFSGGAAFTMDFADALEPALVEKTLSDIGHPEAIVQPSIEADGSFGKSYFIRVGELEPTLRDAEGNIETKGGREKVEESLNALSPATVTGFDTVSGVIAGENVRNAIIAVVVAAFAILIYVSWAFRRVPSPFRYGTTAIIALIHDTVIVLGLFSILGKVVDFEVNAMFITGVLTVIGYSVNDTIVVFDRVRENIARFPTLTITEIVNLSVRETVGRSLNTSITLLIVVIALVLFAAASIQPLLYVLAAGVIVGTYSSIFIATLTLVAWENGGIRNVFSKIPIIGPKPAAN
jgi:preprotein translocase subunit SecF